MNDVLAYWASNIRPGPTDQGASIAAFRLPQILACFAAANHKDFVLTSFRHEPSLFLTRILRPAPQQELSLSFQPVIEGPAVFTFALAVEFVGSLLDLFVGWFPPVRLLVRCLILSQFLLPPVAKLKGRALWFLADSFDDLQKPAEKVNPTFPRSL